jgi:hypothetical protein
MQGTSQRQFAKEEGLPRSTVQGWLQQKDSIEASRQEVAFFESPEGSQVLRRLVVAAHLVMSLLGACGVRLVCLFLQKAGLGPFVGCSYGAQLKVAKEVEAETVAFGRQERARLAADKPPSSVTLVEDETFHHKPCLVAIEPVSNFIVVEEYSEQRDAASWSKAVKKALTDLPGTQVHQVTSDQGKAILRHAETELGVHQSPDIFHVQYEVSRATSLPLAAQTRQAREALDQAQQAYQAILEAEQGYQQRPCGPGRPPNFTARLEAGALVVQQAQTAVANAEANQEALGEILRGIGRTYHPYDLRTGMARSGPEVTTELGALFAKARAVAVKAALSERSRERIEKAARVVPKLAATVDFFHTMVRLWLTALDLPTPVTEALLRVVIPMLYLTRVVRTTQDKAERAAVEAVRRQLEVSWLAAPAAWRSLPEVLRAQAWTLAQQCADLFQRSSSCVEGRNGYLALRNHHLHRIGPSRLQALTVIHNYVLQRSDGTTAAQRFFGAPPRDLFTFLCQRITLPGRPRQLPPRRSRAQPAAQRA